MTESYRIIIADDEGIIRLGLKRILRGLGHTVVATARTGKETLEKVSQIKADLLLLDIEMPEIDGLTVAKTLANSSPLAIIMLTAYSQQSYITAAVDAAVMGYLVKPIDEAKLAPMLDMAVARFAERTAIGNKLSDLKEDLAGLDVINLAKSKLMTEEGLSENQAYHQLQMLARQQQISMADAAARRLGKNSIGGKIVKN